METQSTAPSPVIDFLAPRSYAAAAATEDSSSWEDVDLAQLAREQEEFMEALRTSRGRKRDPPPSTGSDDEQAPNKKQVTSNTPAEPAMADNNISATTTTARGASAAPAKPKNTTNKSALPQRKGSTIPEATSSPAGLKHFLAALSGPGATKTLLMNTVPRDLYYRCCGYYLQFKHGDFSNDKKIRASDKDREAWAVLQGTIKQDAFGKLLSHLKEIQKGFKIFTSD